MYIALSRFEKDSQNAFRRSFAEIFFRFLLAILEELQDRMEFPDTGSLFYFALPAFIRLTLKRFLRHDFFSDQYLRGMRFCRVRGGLFRFLVNIGEAGVKRFHAAGDSSSLPLTAEKF